MKSWGWALNPVDPRIETYLNRLSRPLERTLTAEMVEEVRMDALFHLESLVDRETKRGRGWDEAIVAALEEYGSPDAAGQGMLDEWCRGRQAMTFARLGSAAAWWSFGYFGLAYAASLLVFEYLSLWPGAGIADGQLAATLFTAFSSVLAGFAAGRRVPTGNLAALGCALFPLVPYTLLVALVAGPVMEIPALVAILATCGAVGAVSLSITAWFFRHGRPPVSPRSFHEQSV